MALKLVSGDFTLARGETLTATNETGILVQPPSYMTSGPFVVVDGTLRVDAPNASGFGGANAIIIEGGYSAAKASVTIGATGAVHVTSNGGAYAVFAQNLTNNGLIEVQARTTASVFSASIDGRFENTGTIRVTAGESARTVRMDNHSAFNNSGTIEVVGGSEATFGFEGYRFNAAFVNSGTLKVSDTAVARDCIAVTISGTNDQGGSFLNSGRIEGDVALSFGVGSNFFKPLLTAKVVNTGVMVGKVQMNGGRQELVNSGRIEGVVTLGISDDIYDGRGGTLTHMLHAGAGSDSLQGGDNADALAGNTGDDIISGGGGDDTLEGGAGADTLDGGAGQDLASYLFAERGVVVDLAAGRASGGDGVDSLSGIERVLGSGWGDVLRGGDGAESLSGGGGHDTLEGAAGGDTLTGGAGGDIFRIAANGGPDRIADFNAAEGDRLEIAAGPGFSVLQQGVDAVVEIAGGGRVVLSGVNAAGLPQGSIGAPDTLAPRPGATPQQVSTVTIGADPYVVTEDRSLLFRDANGVLVKAGLPATITVAGVLDVRAAADAVGGLGTTYRGVHAPVYESAGATVRVAQTGVIRADTTAGQFDAVAVRLETSRSQVLNDGFVEALARREAWGVYFAASGPDLQQAIVNTGTIHVSSSEAIAHGLYLPGAGAVTNAGTIDVFGARQAIGIEFRQSGAALDNSGVIRARDSNPDVDSIGVSVDSQMYGRPFINSGVIEADIALRVSVNGAFEGQQFAPAPETFHNQGQMIGRVELGAQRQVLANTGTIDGAVNLGTGADTYAGTAGSVTGMVSGGDGNDSLAGGAGFDNFQGNAGNDTEAGGAGDDWVVGGKDSDLLFGDAGNDLVYGNLGADTCEGGDGDDIIRGGQENDLVSGGAGSDYVSGDRGDDTMTGGGGADLFHSFGEAGIDRVTDFSLAQGDRVQLDPGTQYTVAQVSADTVISMTAGGQVILVGVQMSSLTPGWIFGA